MPETLGTGSRSPGYDLRKVKRVHERDAPELRREIGPNCEQWGATRRIGEGNRPLGDGFFAPERYGEVDRRADVRALVDRDLAPMQADDFLGDGKAKPGTALVARA